MNPSECAAVSVAYRKACFMSEKVRTQGWGWRGCCRDQRTSPPLRNLNVKDTSFVDTMVYNVLLDLPFRRNQPLKSADD